jgi:hypothetical protein
MEGIIPKIVHKKAKDIIYFHLNNYIVVIVARMIKWR